MDKPSFDSKVFTESLKQIEKIKCGGYSELIENVEKYHKQYGVSLSLLKKMNALKPVMHPGPVNIGVELDAALLKSSLYLGYQQVKNSVPMHLLESQ